jgi:hypothetical protein
MRNMLDTNWVLLLAHYRDWLVIDHICDAPHLHDDNQNSYHYWGSTPPDAAATNLVTLSSAVHTYIFPSISTCRGPPVFQNLGVT